MWVLLLVQLVTLCTVGHGLEIVRNPGDWSGVDQILSEAIDNGAFPGCVALVASAKVLLQAD